jgi:hypothetical protein
MSLGQLLHCLCLEKNLFTHHEVSVMMVREDDALIGDLKFFLSRKWNSSAAEFDDQSVFVNNFVMALSQFAMNFHAKPDQLEYFFLVE